MYYSEAFEISLLLAGAVNPETAVVIGSVILHSRSGLYGASTPPTNWPKLTPVLWGNILNSSFFVSILPYQRGSSDYPTDPVESNVKSGKRRCKERRKRQLSGSRLVHSGGVGRGGDAEAAERGPPSPRRRRQRSGEQLRERNGARLQSHFARTEPPPGPRTFRYLSPQYLHSLLSHFISNPTVSQR